VWSDESAFYYINHFREHVWRARNERFSTACITVTSHFDHKIHIWGCFSASGVGELHYIEDILKAEGYQNILQSKLLPYLKRHNERCHYIFQQDNDSKHKAKSTIGWLKAQQIKTLDWPPQSPDLNPIENLWSELDRRTKHRQPKSGEELFGILRNCWNAINPNELQRYTDNMHDRLQAVIDANGWQTKY
jgi:hypothetical protein